jgi:predicted ester cyclase
MKQSSIPTNALEQKFDRGTGTGEPTAEIARLLNLMKQVDDAFNLRDYDRFLDQLHTEDVKVIQFGSESTMGRPPHRNVIEETLAAFPDMRVHNDPYDVQFGQGQWTVAMGRVSGTFTKPMKTPDGETIAPTGKRFETFFTTIAKWKNDQIVEEYVMLDPRDIMKQVVR